VRDGVLAAVSFVPTQAELDAAAQLQNRAAELEQIAASYPLPAMDTLALRYEYTAAGRVKIHKIVRTKDEEILIPVATPLGVPARLRFMDEREAYGLRCVVQDMNGRPRAIDLDRAALPRMAAAEIRSLLFSAGLRTEGEGEAVAVQILKAADPEQEIIAVRRPGWHQIAGYPDPTFVAPSGEVIGAPAGLDLELITSARIAPDVAQSGTMDGWPDAVTMAVSVRRCPHWTLGVVAGFAGTIIDLTGLDTCGINYSGLSSTGKSLSQRLSVSPWSSPDIRRKGLAQSARATDNSVESMAQRGTGTILSLDELAHVAGKILAKMIYMIAGGVGKGRMSPDVGERDNQTWKTFAVLSGECSLEEKIRSDGGEWLAGMAVRIIDVDVTEVDRKVEALKLRAIDGIERHYGHAGPAFIRALVENGAHRKPAELRDRIFQAASELAGEGAAGMLTRAATPLAVLLVAGELAAGFSLLPDKTQIKEAVQWAWGNFLRSSDAAPLDPEVQLISNLQTWIAERWDNKERRSPKRPQ